MINISSCILGSNIDGFENQKRAALLLFTLRRRLITTGSWVLSVSLTFFAGFSQVLIKIGVKP